MLALNTRKLSTTLFITLAVFVAISTVAQAAHESPLLPREHGFLKRIVRKRSPQRLGDAGPPGQVIGAAPIPTSTSTDTVATSTTASSTVAVNSATSTSSTASASTSSTSSGTSSGSSSESASTSSVSSSSTTSTSTTTTPAEPTTTPPPRDTQAAGTPPPQVKSTKTLITSVDAAQTSVPSMAGGVAKVQSNVVTILVAVAASLGGLAILWTIFRKWKLGSSRRFEDRLQPIDWKNASHDDDGIVPAHRRNSGSSFHSAGHGPPAPTRNNNGGLSPLPEHDFTATGGVSPVGGYAEMARGPSPQPFMRENRGYEYGVPLHSCGRY